jgi:hypothetical protein
LKTSGLASAFVLGAVISSGCAAAPTQGAQMRLHTTTAASVLQRPAQGAKTQVEARSAHKSSSPLTRACKGGDSKACGQLGDRLTIKYAYEEAHEWYTIACKRVSSAMMPTANRVLLLSQELTRLSAQRSDDEGQNAANQQRIVELKSEASEIRARIQGCFDAGDTLKLEPKQALTYFDTVCEFRALVEATGEGMPGLEHIAEIGCTAGQTVRAKLNDRVGFEPQLFAELVQQQARTVAAKQSATQDEQGMVFNETDM